MAQIGGNYRLLKAAVSEALVPDVLQSRRQIDIAQLRALAECASSDGLQPRVCWNIEIAETRARVKRTLSDLFDARWENDALQRRAVVEHSVSNLF